MALRDRINKLLKDNGKRPVDIANYVSVSRATVADWMSGKTKTISSENAFKVASFFKVSAEWVATGNGSERPNIGTAKEPGEIYSLEVNRQAHALMFETLNQTDMSMLDRQMLEQMVQILYDKYVNK